MGRYGRFTVVHAHGLPARIDPACTQLATWSILRFSCSQLASASPALAGGDAATHMPVLSWQFMSGTSVPRQCTYDCLSESGTSMQDLCSCAVSHTRLAEGGQTGEAAQAALWECAEASCVPTCAPRSFSGWWPSQGHAPLELCSAISAPPALPSAAGARCVRR